MKLLKLRARQKVSSFFSRTFQTKLNSVAYLGLGRIRLTSRAYDYMNMMWILRRSIIKISFIFRIYDVNMLLHIFICSYSNIAMMICKKALRLMLVFMLVYWMRSKLNLVCCGPTYPIKSQGTREKNLGGPGVWNTLQFDSILSMSGDQIFGAMQCGQTWSKLVQRFQDNLDDPKWSKNIVSYHWPLNSVSKFLRILFILNASPPSIAQL